MNEEDISIIVITLEKYNHFSLKNTNKLKLKLKELGYGNCRIKFIGINGFNLKGKKVRESIVSKSVAAFGLGSFGCALSHACVLKIIKGARIHNHVLVLEEDALIKQDFLFLKNLTKEIPKDYDICFLHSYWREAFYLQNKEPGKDINKGLLFTKILDNRIKNPTGLNAYLVNGKNIDKTLEVMLPIKGGIDWHVFRQSLYLNSYIINPNFNFCTNPPWDYETAVPSVRHKMDDISSKVKS